MMIKYILFFVGVVMWSGAALGVGGNGATCNPSTPSWGACSVSQPSWQTSVTHTINIPAGILTTPYVASQAGTRYVLQGDVNANSTGIRVTADYIIIDLNGYTLTYNQLSAGSGVVAGAWNLNNFAVINGTILQGAAASEGDEYGRGNNPISTYDPVTAQAYGVPYTHVSNIHAVYGGRDNGGIVCLGSNGLYEQNTIEDTYEFGTLKNRAQGVEALAGAKLSTSTTGSVYRYNTIINARNKGITVGSGSESYENHITIRSIVTNSSGIYQHQGKNVSIHDNTIIARGEHPIGVAINAGDGIACENWDVYNNYIDAQTTALGVEYGSSYATNPEATYTGNSASGVNVRWGADDINVYNNTIVITTDSRYVGTYSPTGETAYINGGGKGLFVGAYSGQTTTYKNNIISVTGTGSYNYGVTCSYNFSEGLFVLNNTITSSQYNIVMGDDYGACNHYPMFKSNTLIKDGVRADYKTYTSTYNSSELDHPDETRNSTGRLVDNIYQGGATETSISLHPEGGGLTDVYFGTYNNGFIYSKQLHDNGGLSSTLIETIHDPAITLAYRNPVVAQVGRHYRARLAGNQ